MGPKPVDSSASTAMDRARAATRRASVAPVPVRTLPDRAAMRRAVIIEDVQPSVDGGRYPVKRVVGTTLTVTADIFREGQDAIVAFLGYRRTGEEAWRQTPMRHVDNDRWTGSFLLDDNARFVFVIEALADPFRSWLADLDKRLAADQDVTSELLEGAALVRAAADRAKGALRKALVTFAERIAEAPAPPAAVAIAHEAGLVELMTASLDRSTATRSEREYEVVVDRERAGFAAWYEFFPRSARHDGRPATLREAESMLDRAAAMGFDVVYLPPIHPIGRTNRKGRNNRLTAGPGDPGSPWAIGDAEGGHRAVHPDLGSIHDFDAFVDAARRRGLEVALDFAIQCSPDHPWVREHPEWFFHRPDGTIKYAENPPKKYQDIYPVNFYGDDPGPLWLEMHRVLAFWLAHGVRTFRVDNPHTKPVRFWEWLIREIQTEHPDVIFLSEAFTRPTLMRVLAKAGFTQSYTYFTWRNSKQEIIDYFEEITRPPVSEYFRGHLWPNTPDILHHTLQTGGPAAFKLRVALAATLSSLYGIYSGYELCENVPAAPGSEEYLDSEKYQIKVRDWNAAGDLTAYITRLNAIRRQHRALQHYANLTFYRAEDPHVLWYGKATPDRSDVVFVAANLDPHGVHASVVDVPIGAFGVAPDGSYRMHELLSDRSWQWRGGRGYVELDPRTDPVQIFSLRTDTR